MKRDDGGPAFPQSLTLEREFVGSDGMSLRDYFAGQVLGSIVGDAQWSAAAMQQREWEATPVGPSQVMARICYSVADAMIAARKVNNE